MDSTLDLIWAVLTGDLVWGIIVGLDLSALANCAMVEFEVQELRKQQQELITKFSIETVRNLMAIIQDLGQNREHLDIISHEFLALIDAEVAVFSRNREHVVHLQEDQREALRTFVNNVVIKRAETVGYLDIVDQRSALAHELKVYGQNLQAQAAQETRDAALAKAHATLDQLMVHADTGQDLVTLLRRGLSKT
jgi:hypothetical protein